MAGSWRYGLWECREPLRWSDEASGQQYDWTAVWGQRIMPTPEQFALRQPIQPSICFKVFADFQAASVVAARNVTWPILRPGRTDFLP